MISNQDVLRSHNTKRPSNRVKRNRRALAIGASVIALGSVSHKAVGNVIDHSLTGSHELPALDTDFQVRGPQDTPDNIADHSGVQGSQDREDFDKAILDEAHQQGEDELKQGMQIKVPHAYVEYVQNQKNEANQR